ncbi:hypothetical protein DY000_02034169 [Brassica cretica]|uniref:Uncharacterized protein n=1 Tax=Brassica cretica TaxID=69181 RepID=A0ABQ7DNL0_BRACR|nr:hypothetical protein DY000_02034169 [Brassica cretica]
MHLGCSALSGTVTRVALLSGTVTQTVPRENLQIALFSASFVPTGASSIKCNSRPTFIANEARNGHFMEKRDRASQVVSEIVTKQAGETSKRDWYFTRQIVAVKEEKLKHNSITELRMYL